MYENPEIKSQICFLSDTPYFFQNADLREMRDYYAAVYPTFNRKQFDSLTGIFHLDMKRRVNSFSKGMKKQVSILLGLCAGTKYLLCDETFDGLDPVVRQAVKSLFAAELVNRDFTPVIASHNLRELKISATASGCSIRENFCSRRTSTRFEARSANCSASSRIRSGNRSSCAAFTY